MNVSVNQFDPVCLVPDTIMTEKARETQAGFKGIAEASPQGAKLRAHGLGTAVVAPRFGVARQTVAHWERLLEEGGEKGMNCHKLGSPPRLSEGQCVELRGMLPEGDGRAGLGHRALDARARY